MTPNTNKLHFPFFRQHPDPIVQVIINTPPTPDGFLQACTAYANNPHPKLRALMSMMMAEAGLLSIKEADKQAQAAYQASSHVDLHLFFLAVWYGVLLEMDELPFEQLKAIEAAMDSFISTETPPELLGTITMVKAHACNFTGNYKRQFELLDHVLDNVPLASPFYSRLHTIQSMTYFPHGMGQKVEEPFPQQEINDFDLLGFTLTKFADEVLRGRLEQAQARLNELPKFPQQHKYLRILAGQTNRARALMLLMMQAKGENLTSLQNLQKSENTENWFFATRALLQRKPAEALYWARLHLQKDNSTIGQQFIFVDHTLVRSELAAGNGAAAKHLLIDLSQRGTSNYFDSFYHARAERLLGNWDLARAYFLKFKEELDFYQAHNRFDFEINLALELSASDLLKLHAAISPIKLISQENHFNKITNKGISKIISLSPEMEKVKNAVINFANLDQPVLITGETGTGKELIAHALHELSFRSEEPFIAINCSSIPETLIESELFGHASGAFTGAQNSYKGIFLEAGNGTVFLDEIGDIPPRLQLALLRVLESGEVRSVGSATTFKISCRIVAATNKNLYQKVNDGSFPSDLFYRLQRLEIFVPPLQERLQDIPPIVDFLLNNNRIEGNRVQVSKAFLDKLLQHDWPGNVRELRNVVERLRLLNSNKLYYDVSDLNQDSLIDRLDQNLRIRSEIEIIKESPSMPTLSKQLPATNQRPTDIHGFLASGRTAFRRKLCLRELFTEVKELKVSEAAVLLGVSQRTASRYMSVLCREGFIKKVTPNPSPRSHYYVAIN